MGKINLLVEHCKKIQQLHSEPSQNILLFSHGKSLSPQNPITNAEIFELDGQSSDDVIRTDEI